MTYKHITIIGRVEPLATVLTEDYAKGVAADMALANAAPAMAETLRYLRDLGLPALADPALTPKDIAQHLDMFRALIQYTLRQAEVP